MNTYRYLCKIKITSECMLNEDLILYIESYLIQCNSCSKLNQTSVKNQRICCYCRKYICEQCDMILDYTEYETRMWYCVPCHQFLFSA